MNNNIEIQLPKNTASIRHIDQEKFDKLLNLLGDNLISLVTQFITHGKQLIDEMRIAANNANAADLAKATHTLKGGSSSLGATLLANSCETLYQNARNGNLEQALAHVEAISEQFKDAHNTLSILIKQK